MSNLTSKIAQVYPSLTRAQRIIASYLTEHPDVLAFTTLEDLARVTGVSTPTVIRFARAMGYGGYSDLQKSAQDHLLDKESLPSRLADAASRLKSSELLKDSFHSNIEAINQTLDSLSESDLQAAVDAICAAKSVYLLGMRSSFAVAYYMTARLAQVKPHVHLIQSPGMLFPEQISGCGPGDLCIAFIFPHALRYSKLVKNLMGWMKQHGARILLITNHSDMMVHEDGDIVLPCFTDSISFKNSLAVPICLTDYLTTAVALADEETTQRTLEKTEDILNHYSDFG